ncbi:SpdD protein [Streptomyces sp. 378]|uniref:SpdD protein n=1 Tax=Streptomyces sp. 378 TaxID=3049412 RepID=UPI0024C46EAB|nr:SpdD protein [Streptomyces sp. 378]MDK1348031.1 SpdD protein [Streptomyces sp. 378]
MFLPKYPDSPTPPPAHTHTPTEPAPVRRSLPSVSVDQKTVVVVGGVVLTALLAAVAVTAISVAVAAVVLRSMLRDHHRR